MTRGPCLSRVEMRHPCVIGRQIGHPFAVKHHARADRCGEKRAVERRARRHGELRRTVGSASEFDARGARSVLKRRVIDGDCGKRGDVDCVAHEIERAAGDTAAAGFFARVAAVEQCDARSGARQAPGCSTSGWTSADDGDIDAIHHFTLR